jgi:hypothetical protein
MEDGYTFTTISCDDGTAIRISTTFHLDGLSFIQVYGVGGEHVHLSIERGAVCVSVAPRSGDQVTAQDVDIARRLVDAATTYLAEIQRLHIEHTDRPERSDAA